MAKMENNVEYVLPLGRPATEGGLSNPSWLIFVRWILQLSDDLGICTFCSPADVKYWFGISHDTEIETISHPDPNFGLKGFRLSAHFLDFEHLSRVPVSEESGVAFFSWTKGDAALAAIDVDDFENFAVIKVEPEAAKRLATATAGAMASWDRDRLLEYKWEIDQLSTTGHWILVSDILDSYAPSAPESGALRAITPYRDPARAG